MMKKIITLWLALIILSGYAIADAENPLQKKLSEITERMENDVPDIIQDKIAETDGFTRPPNIGTPKLADNHPSKELADRMTNPLIGILNLTRDITEDYAYGTEDNSTEVGRLTGQLRNVMDLPVGDGTPRQDDLRYRTNIPQDDVQMPPGMTHAVELMVTEQDEEKMLESINDKPSLQEVMEDAKKRNTLQAREDLNNELSEFVKIFNEYTNKLRKETQQVIKSGSDQELSANVIISIANRELSKIREIHLEKISIDEKTVEDEIEKIAGLKTEKKTILKETLKNIDTDFKKKMAFTAANAELEEKRLIRKQLQDYVQDKETEKPEIVEEAKNGQIDAKRIRNLLNLDVNNEMMWEGILD